MYWPHSEEGDDAYKLTGLQTYHNLSYRIILSLIFDERRQHAPEATGARDLRRAANWWLTWQDLESGG